MAPTYEGSLPALPTSCQTLRDPVYYMHTAKGTKGEEWGNVRVGM